ncbi:MAG: sigma-70 family RNA polymerase sigma factor [Verrucomicrobiales bacterium]|nr:sigma-70 family RNA polymerase sigma factor [Verrucomicrobiales bacterium]
MSQDEAQSHAPDPGRDFRTTHWSVVIRAREHWSDQSREALERLCRTYWYPIYVFVRRRGFGSHEAEDLTQGFFTKLLEKNYLESADRDKGRFRTFLLTAVTRFLANEWDRERALKRGGGQTVFSLEDLAPEGMDAYDPPSDQTPEHLYERQWAEAVLQQVLARLRGEFDGAGRAEVFDELKSFLLEEKGAVSYADVAKRLNLTLPALKSSIFRLRQRYRDLLQDEISNTVATPQEVEDEIRYLVAVLSR